MTESEFTSIMRTIEWGVVFILTFQFICTIVILVNIWANEDKNNAAKG